MAACGAFRPVVLPCLIGRRCPIVLKNSLSAMFDLLEGLWAGIQKISWGTSQFVDGTACEVLNRF